ncbi:MAG: GTP cyclohydrolase I FolE [Ignavibacteria bacterium]|nr:GTP cyclohydrolase I FolE [Ignavibacteria bacterium]
MTEDKKSEIFSDEDDNIISGLSVNGNILREIEKNVKGIISLIGEDPDREGLIKTPSRVAKSYMYLTKGYKEDAEELLNNAIFYEHYDEMVIVKDIDFYSLCEHHMLPFYGKCHVAYIPNGKIVGLSKIPRIVDMYARRLQVQERMTREIGDMLNKVLEPKGVAVVTEAHHLCMIMRGVEKQNSVATASCMLGRFKSDDKTRTEFLKLIGK